MRVVIALILLLASCHPAYAWGTLQLQSCDYQYISSQGRSAYVGVYEHPSGDRYVYIFSTYCPQTINM